MSRFTSRFLVDHPLARRALLEGVARSCLGVSLAAGWSRRLEAAPTAKAGRATRVISLFMTGAMSHIDTFDPKPGREEQGATKAIKTKTAGVLFGESLPKLAAMSDRLAVIRSLSTETGAHESAAYLMRTAYSKLNSMRHPSIGAWMLHSQGKVNQQLPGYVLVGSGNDHPGAGFLDPGLTPVPIADPNKGLENTKRPGYLTEEIFRERLELAEQIDRDFAKRYAGRQLDAYDKMYKEATRLMGSVDLQAFDLGKEKPEIRERYGASRLGAACLLARRLVESGVRCVEVEHGGWDMHRDIFNDLPKRAGELDHVLATLLDDLRERGLLDSTLVVLATEFGRSPKVNENAGRDHHPGVFSCILAGAGVKTGVVHGSSDARGHSPEKDGVSIADFNTTIAAACGLPIEKEFFSPSGRPFKIGGGGRPIAAVLS